MFLFPNFFIHLCDVSFWENDYIHNNSHKDLYDFYTLKWEQGVFLLMMQINFQFCAIL